jgi:AbiV family abortive infection protein
MTNSPWVLTSGLELPEPDIPWYVPQAVIDGQQSFGGFRSQRPSPDVAQRALDTYHWADENAIALLEEARFLEAKGRFARAFASACTALEEIGKSQYAADVYTGFISPDDFEKNMRNHRHKTRYAGRAVLSGGIQRPLLGDEKAAERIFDRRNQALYASPTKRVDDADFEHDARTMIDYCETWIERIRSQEEIAERIGTKAFLK